MILAPSTQTIKTQDAPDIVTPYMLGVMDAEENLPCVPETYYIKQGQMAEYCEGYEAVAGETLTTRQILGKPLLTDEQIKAEFSDLVEGMSDEEFWSRGQW